MTAPESEFGIRKVFRHQQTKQRKSAVNCRHSARPAPTDGVKTNGTDLFQLRDLQRQVADLLIVLLFQDPLRSLLVIIDTCRPLCNMHTYIATDGYSQTRW